jgi:ABC-type antimicrobial peptide transport system permease subunit
VIGVVGNVQDTSLAATPAPTMYFPQILQRDSVTRHTARTMALVVRASGDQSAIVASVQRAVRDIDPSLPLFDVHTLNDSVRASTARLAFTILILAAAAAVTLVLGVVGLYGVMAYVVTLRRRELGIRIALGASPRSVAAQTTRQGILIALAGAALGLLLFAGTTRFLRGFLYGIAPWDALAITGATLLLLFLAAIAAWIPARRAGSVDPTEALRAG